MLAVTKRRNTLGLASPVRLAPAGPPGPGGAGRPAIRLITAPCDQTACGASCNENGCGGPFKTPPSTTMKSRRLMLPRGPFNGLPRELRNIMQPI